MRKPELVLQNGMVLFSAFHLFYLGRNATKARLILNDAGIRYRSGRALWRSVQSAAYHF